MAAQDRRALARQLDNIERFGAPRFLQGPGDPVLGARVARLYYGERLGTGTVLSPPPTISCDFLGPPPSTSARAAGIVPAVWGV